MSAASAIVFHMHNPWEALAALKGWTLTWAHLPKRVLGYTCWETREVILRHGLCDQYARSTAAHEYWHAVRGPVPEWMQIREERTVELLAARQLIDLDALGEALAWSGDLQEVAEDLWVDPAMVQARLDGLSPRERTLLMRRLEHLEGD